MLTLGLTFKKPPYVRIHNNNFAITDEENIFIKTSSNKSVLQSELESFLLLGFEDTLLIKNVLENDGEYFIVLKYLPNEPLSYNNLSKEDIRTVARQIHQIHNLPPAAYTQPRSIRYVNTLVQQRLSHPMLNDTQILNLTRLSTAFIYPYLEKYKEVNTLAHTDVKIDNLLKLANGVRLIDYESIKVSPIEVDLASIYQDFCQTGQHNLYLQFSEEIRKLEHIDEEALVDSILFKNTLTTLIAARLKDPNVLNERIEILSESIRSLTPPAALPKVDLTKPKH